MKNSLKFAFLEFVNQHQLLEKGQRVLVAVSGGIDSMVLLQLLRSWRQYFELEIGVAHFNHQLRGKASDDDEAFVREYCKTQSLPFFTDKGDVAGTANRRKYSPEEAARVLREEFLMRCLAAEHYDAAATAHHLNDQAETVLMRMLAGAGLDGLAGIRLRRSGFIRPLLFAEKKDIISYARENGIAHREDETNTLLKIPRNKIRQQLIPYLEAEFGLTNLGAFLRSGLILQELLPEMEKQVESALKEAVSVESQNKIRLDIIPYTTYFSWIQVKLVENLLTELSGRQTKLTYNRFHDFSKWLKQTQDGDTYLLQQTVLARRKQQEIWFEYNEQPVENIDVYEYIDAGSDYQNPALGIAVKINLVSSEDVRLKADGAVEYLDAQQLTFPLLLRNWQPGDRFQPLGLAHPKKVSDFLTDESKLMLPKSNMLVLENQGEIISVIGARIGDKFKLTDRSRKILKIELRYM